MEGDSNIVLCKCGNAIEVLEGDVGGFKNEKGKNLSK